MRREPVVVSGVGAVTPVGAGAVQTCASVRAGLSGLRRHPTHYAIPPDPMVDDPERVACGFAAGDPEAMPVEGRMLRLASAATRDLVRSAGLTRAETNETDVMVCVARPDRPPGGRVADLVARELPRRLGMTPRSPVRAMAEDQPGTLRAIAEASQRIAVGEVDRCLVLAVDSLVGEDTLLWFDRRDRLRSPRTADGFLAGEAAACVLLERRSAVEARGGTSLAIVGDVGVGDEPHTFEGDANSTARGLCDAIRAATVSWAGRPVAWAICDMNGESFWAYEWGLACSRLGSMLGSTELWHPADCMGAVGAASAVLALVMAGRAFAAGYAPDDRVLVWCASDGKRRAACALQAPGAANEPKTRR